MAKNQQHIPVLMEEVLYFLDLKPGKIYLDVTLGGGGHTRAILEQEPTCKVIGMDWDISVIDSIGEDLKEEFKGRFFPIWGNFSKIYYLVKKAGFNKVDGILADFGTSQIQIHTTDGLSVYNDTFLDMRLSSAHFKKTAYDIVNWATEKELADIFYTYGEERYGRKIAQAIVEYRKKKRLKTTFELVDLIKSSVPSSRGKIHPATRVFQALRIVVNKELENIEHFLKNVPSILVDGGRLVCISFHSLEDRIVKLHFKNQNSRTSPKVYFELLTKKVCMASEEELGRNRSARSARLRAAILRKTI